MTRSRSLAWAAALALAGACAPPPQRPVERPPVLLLAVDGLDWDVLLPLVRDGQVPALAGLMERGVAVDQ